MLREMVGTIGMVVNSGGPTVVIVCLSTASAASISSRDTPVSSGIWSTGVNVCGCSARSALSSVPPSVCPTVPVVWGAAATRPRTRSLRL